MKRFTLNLLTFSSVFGLSSCMLTSLSPSAPQNPIWNKIDYKVTNGSGELVTLFVDTSHIKVEDRNNHILSFWEKAITKESDSKSYFFLRQLMVNCIDKKYALVQLSTYNDPFQKLPLHYEAYDSESVAVVNNFACSLAKFDQ